VSVLILSHFALHLVAALFVTQLSEGEHVHIGRDGGADQEERESFEWPSSQWGHVEERAACCSAHQYHSGESPEEASMEVAAAVSVRVESHLIASFLVLVKLW
jgi:hypothetical protein